MAFVVLYHATRHCNRRELCSDHFMPISEHFHYVFFTFHPLYHCKLAIAWQEGMSAYGQMEVDATKPI